MNPAKKHTALLYANVVGDPSTDVTLQKSRLADEMATSAKPTHMELYPIGFFPLDDSTALLIQTTANRTSTVPKSSMKSGLSRIAEDDAPWFGSQHSKDVGRFDRRIIIRETASKESISEPTTTTSRLPPVLSPEEKARIAEEKKKEEEALLLASVMEKNIYKKQEDTIQGMLGKLAVRMWEDSVAAVKAKIWKPEPKKK